MSVIIGLLILSAIIVVHEFGHFLAARMVGVPVTRFAVGMGGEVAGFTRNGTRYSLGFLPLGGYVSFAEVAGESALESKPYWAKTLVTSAGVLMNLLLAVVLLSVLLSFDSRVVISDGHSYQSALVEGRPLHEAVLASIVAVWQTMVTMLALLPQAIIDAISAPSAAEVSGPVGIVNTLHHTATVSFGSALHIAAVLSIAVAAFNILPILPLDGGHLLRYTIEFAIRRPLPKRWINIAATTGFVLIMGLFVFVTVLDILKIF